MAKTPNESGDRAPSRRLASLGRGLIYAVAVAGGILIYAYGFQVTQVSLEEARSPSRQERLVRILRALAEPDLVEYDEQETTAETSVWVPCPKTLPAFEPPSGTPSLSLEPRCGAPGERITAVGNGFPPGADGRVYFVPPNGIRLSQAEFRADTDGAFSVSIQLPERASPEVQTVLAAFQRNVGAPRLTRNAYDTWDKIVETVFMALLGTTFGTMVAVPLSFLAARNLMKDITGTVGGLALIVMALPVGALLGAIVSRVALAGSAAVTSSPFATAVVASASLAVVARTLRWAMPSEETSTPSLRIRAARIVALLVASLLGLLGSVLAARLMSYVGDQLAELLGLAAFIGTFLADLGDVLELILGAAAVGGVAVVVASLSGTLGARLRPRLPPSARRPYDLTLSALAGAVLGLLLGAFLAWLYRLVDVRVTVVAPAAVGAVVGLLLGWRAGTGDTFPIGLVVYNLTRTVLNVLRAVEPLIMVIVVAVWVGIGPFAGVLALSLHTVAALGKLFSEDVETIQSGPLEAVTATGATRLQMIVYAVVPQIVPTYVSLTMYRWDINVRLSTIIGFAGGGGIGFLLSQNANLGNYRAASAQILAIALVVTAMDYLSTYLRGKAV